MTIALPPEFERGIPADIMREVAGLMDPLTWSSNTAKIILPKSGGKPMTFERHPFLPALYRDTHPHIVALKGAQIGVSTWAFIRALWAVTTWPISVIYTHTDPGPFTQTRINPVVQASTYLAERIVDVESVHVKRFGLVPISALPEHARGSRSLRLKYMSEIGLSTLYFKGSTNPKEAISTDADMLIHDEEDKADPETIEMYSSRLSGPSEFKWTTRLSTPTIPGVGIDRAYQLTDRRHWLITCPSCNIEFELDYPANITPHTWEEHAAEHEAVIEGQSCPDCHYVCANCGHVLSDLERGNGVWRAELESQGLPHGYQVSQMAALYVPAVQILRSKFDYSRFPRQFWNMTMGRAYDEGGQSFTKEALVGVSGTADTGRTDPIRPMAPLAPGPCVLGVDVGNSLDWVVEDFENRVLAFGRTADWGHLDWLMEHFNVSTCVMDALPETSMARGFSKKWNRPGVTRVWLCYFGTENSDVRYDDTNEGDRVPRVYSPRSRLLTETASEILEVLRLPRYDPGSPVWEAFIEHHVNSKRVAVLAKGLEKEGIVESYQWVRVGADHLFLAGAYARLARLAPRTALAPRVGLVSLNRAKEQARREADENARPVFRQRQG